MISCALAAIANVAIARHLNFNLFTLRLWFIIPAGAGIVGFVATSGALLVAWALHIRPRLWDIVLSALVIGAGTMALIYYIDYRTLVLSDGRHVSDIVEFWRFVDFSLTKTHTRVGKSQIDLGETGDLGYLYALLELAGFVFGAACTFGLLLGLPVCKKCDAYLRRLRKKSTADTTPEDTAKLHELFSEGDVATLRAVIKYHPEKKLAGKEKRGSVTFELLQCPKCQEQTISLSLSIFNGSDWKELKDLRVLRTLPRDVSLDSEFAKQR